MTERVRQISSFVTPLGLFEWMRMRFDLKNALQYISDSWITLYSFFYEFLQEQRQTYRKI